MSYGIFRHGPVKTFLTRGFLKEIFQPLLYSQRDKLHYTFAKCLSSQLEKVSVSIEEEYFERTAHWLLRVPKNLFELLFLSKNNSQNILPVPIFNGKIENNGDECAYITQAFVLCVLEQLLKNDKEYEAKLGLSIEHFEILTHDSLIGANTVVKHLNKYRKVFSSTRLDPRDFYIIYIGDICDTLIPDRERGMKAMGSWDNDILAKMDVISQSIRFFAKAKETSLKDIKEM